jgi:hypothetical protein
MKSGDDEPLEDGAEIMWTEHEAMKLNKLRSMSHSVDELKVSAKNADRSKRESR